MNKRDKLSEAILEWDCNKIDKLSEAILQWDCNKIDKLSDARQCIILLV